MREKLNNFYMKRSSFIFFAIVSMLAWLSWAIATIIENNPVKLTVFALIFLILTTGITLAYIKGETNVQKMLFGSLMIFFIIDFIEVLDLFISLKNVSASIIFGMILAALIVFYICHTLQQQDHIGESIIIIINQCCGMIAALSVIFLIVNLVEGDVAIADYTFCLSVTFTMLLIICMETRISSYKKLRAKHKANGDWNEENRTEAKKLFKI